MALARSSKGRMERRQARQEKLRKSPCRQIATRNLFVNAQGASSEATEGSTPRRLSGGRRRHTLSVFVGDESGMINRVSGVFARRGFNIESLAVGLSNAKALFTVVAIGTDAEANALRKQLLKLINVKSVDNLTDLPTCEKGLMLLKVAPDESSNLAEILELAHIFNARTVDVAESELTLAVTGDPGKTGAVQHAFSKFNIIEVARTGKLAISREPARSHARRQRLDLIDAVSQTRALSKSHANNDSPDDPPGDTLGSQEELAQMVLNGSHAALALEDMYKPVIDARAAQTPAGYGYAAYDDDASSNGSSGRGRLSSHAGSASSLAHEDSHTLSIRVENQPGVLNRVTGVIARRGYNVVSVGVGPSESPEVSRITLVVPGTEDEIASLLKQLYKLVSVLEAVDLTNVPFVEQELMMIKVRCTRAQRSELMELVNIFNAKAVDVSDDTMTIETVGNLEKNVAFQDLLHPYGILELARTGRVALPRSSGIDTRMLEDLEGSYALA